MTPGWDAGLATWATLEAFYAAVPPHVRRYSGESDFGVWWWDGRQGYSDQWRVSCVENTGEIYAVMMRGNLRASQPRVVLLGSLGPDPGYVKSHGCLVGWEDVCGAGDSLEWAVNRVRLATGTVAAVEAPLVSPSHVSVEDTEGLLRLVYAALREARPYVFYRIDPRSEDWRTETARDVLTRVDGALANAEKLIGRVEVASGADPV